MSFFYLHPDDAKWLRRWLRNNLLCMSAIVGFLLVIQAASSDPPKTMRQADAAAVETSFEVITPEGWRRTNDGWEHTSMWTLAADPSVGLAEYLPIGQPVWVELTLGAVRDIPPLVYAVIQIAFIAVILRFAKTQRPVNTTRGRRRNQPASSA